jgi:hypothetical protein
VFLQIELFIVIFICDFSPGKPACPSQEFDLSDEPLLQRFSCVEMAPSNGLQVLAPCQVVDNCWLPASTFAYKCQVRVQMP